MTPSETYIGEGLCTPQTIKNVNSNTVVPNQFSYRDEAIPFITVDDVTSKFQASFIKETDRAHLLLHATV